MEPNELAAVAGRYRDMIYRVALHWCGHHRRLRMLPRTRC